MGKDGHLRSFRGAPGAGGLGSRGQAGNRLGTGAENSHPEAERAWLPRRGPCQSAPGAPVSTNQNLRPHDGRQSEPSRAVFRVYIEENFVFKDPWRVWKTKGKVRERGRWKPPLPSCRFRRPQDAAIWTARATALFPLFSPSSPRAGAGWECVVWLQSQCCRDIVLQVPPAPIKPDEWRALRTADQVFGQ